MKKGFRKISTLVLTIGLIISLLGITYAFFEYTLTTNSVVYNTGEIWFKLLSESNTLSLDGVLPETREEALYVNGNKDNIREDNIIEFTLQSKNTSAKNIWYELNIVEGAEVPSKTRLDKKYIRFDLFDVTNDNYILKDVSFYEFPDGKIYVDAVTAGHDINDTSSYFEITYSVRAWIDYDLIVSDTDPQADYCASDSCTTGKPIFSNYYGSVQINVKSDQIEKTNPFAYIRNQTENKESVLGNSGRMYGSSMYSGVGNTFGDEDYNFYYLENYSLANKESRLSYRTMLYPSDIYLYDEDGVPTFNTNGFYKYAETIENIDVVKLSEEEINEMLVDPTVLYLKDITDDRVSNSSKVYMYIKANGNTISSKPAYDLTIASSSIIMFPEDSSNLFSYFDIETDREAAYQKYLIACEQFESDYNNSSASTKADIDSILTNNHNPQKQGYDNVIDLIESYLYDYYMVGYDDLYHQNGFFSPIYPSTEEAYILGYTPHLYDPLLSKYVSMMGEYTYHFSPMNAQNYYAANVEPTFVSEAEPILRTITDSNAGGLIGKKITEGFRFKNLKHVNIDNVCTSQVTNMTGMFMFNDKLESVNLSKINTRNVTRLDAMFMGTKIPYLDLSSFNTKKLKSLFLTFAYANIDNLTGFDNWDLTNLFVLKGAFTWFCSNGMLDLSGWQLDTSKLLISTPDVHPKIQYLDVFYGISIVDFTSTNNVFQYINVNSLDLSNWKISIPKDPYSNSNSILTSNNMNVQNLIVKNAIIKHTSVTSYSSNVKNFDFTNSILDSVEYGNMSNTISFNLTNAKIKGSVSDFYTSLNNKATFNNTDFSGVDSLVYFAYNSRDEEIDFSKYNFNYGSIKSLACAFKYCTFLKSIDLSFMGNMDKLENISEIFYGCEKMISINMGTISGKNIKTISKAFYNNYRLTNLIFPKNNFSLPNLTDMNEAFYNCSSLTSLDLSNFGQTKVQNIKYAFYYCSKLVSLDLSNFETSKITNLNQTFCHCENVTSLDLSGFDTSEVTTMQGMFSQCYKLANLDLTGWNTSKVTTMQSMFRECGNLTSLNLSSFNTSNVTSMKEMFYQCYRLANLDLSGWNTKKVKNMNSMFFQNQCLTVLNISSFDTYAVTDFGSMFGWSGGDTNQYGSSSRGITKIIVSPYNSTNQTGWTIANGGSTTDSMFSYTANLVGGAGTTNTWAGLDHTYARIDGGTSAPGLLSSS